MKLLKYESADGNEIDQVLMIVKDDYDPKFAEEQAAGVFTSGEAELVAVVSLDEYEQGGELDFDDYRTFTG